MQRVSEGWAHVPPPDGNESGENSLQEPSSLVEEEVPENLGHGWRVLHPFELPGVRFPTSTTPPNERRLAENDALVELLSIWKIYPCGDKEINGSIPLGIVTLSIEEEEEVEEEGK